MIPTENLLGILGLWWSSIFRSPSQWCWLPATSSTWKCYLLFTSHPIRLPLPKPSRGLLQITLQRNPLRGNCCYALVPYENINWTETAPGSEFDVMSWGVERGLLRALTQGNKVRPQGAGDLITTLRLIPLITNVSDLHESQIKQTEWTELLRWYLRCVH